MSIEFKMTPRLQVLADQVERGQSVADIGTDHGYLPLYLWAKGISPKVIMGDVSPGSLDKARQSCKEYFPEEEFDLRLGDGLDVLKDGEVDAVVMAGIGGNLMTEIMAWDMRKTLSIEKFILQPRNHVGYLRKWLSANGFTIVKEELVRERKYLCEILTVLTPEAGRDFVAVEGPVEVEFHYPDSLVEDRNPLTEEYLMTHMKKAQIIRDRIMKGRGDAATSSPEYIETCRVIERLKLLLDKLN